MTDVHALPKRLEDLLRRNGAPADVKVSDVKPIAGGYSLLTFGFTATSAEGTRLADPHRSGARVGAAGRAHRQGHRADAGRPGL